MLNFPSTEPLIRFSKSKVLTRDDTESATVFAREAMQYRRLEGRIAYLLSVAFRNPKICLRVLEVYGTDNSYLANDAIRKIRIACLSMKDDAGPMKHIDQYSLLRAVYSEFSEAHTAVRSSFLVALVRRMPNVSAVAQFAERYIRNTGSFYFLQAGKDIEDIMRSHRKKSD